MTNRTFLRCVFLMTLLVPTSLACVTAQGGRDPVASPRRPPILPELVADPACQVKSIEKAPSTFENIVKSTTSDFIAVSKADAKQVYQLYVGKDGSQELTCLTCTARPGGPRVDRNKMMISLHPSGQWLTVGIEEEKHALQWAPKSWQRGLLQSGVNLDIWITTPTGDRWFRITDFREGKNPKKGFPPSDGFVGVSFSPDGKKAVWAEIINGNIFLNPFGVWRLYIADFEVSSDGTPSLANQRDITPASTKWIEPGNFAPDGRHILISADTGLKEAQGQDQFALDVVSGQVTNLTNTPDVWDEHGVYSRSGNKITFMSSYPFRSEKGLYKNPALKTEFMMMDADGSHLQQLTHFNTPGYPESQRGRTIAAVAGFLDNGSQLFATVMAQGFHKTNWIITFQGRCDR